MTDWIEAGRRMQERTATWEDLLGVAYAWVLEDGAGGTDHEWGWAVDFCKEFLRLTRERGFA